jgi:hypothetical protein
MKKLFEWIKTKLIIKQIRRKIKIACSSNNIKKVYAFSLAISDNIKHISLINANSLSFIYFNIWLINKLFIIYMQNKYLLYKHII